MHLMTGNHADIYQGIIMGLLYYFTYMVWYKMNFWVNVSGKVIGEAFVC